MSRRHRSPRQQLCAPVLAASLAVMLSGAAVAQSEWPDGRTVQAPFQDVTFRDGGSTWWSAGRPDYAAFAAPSPNETTNRTSTAVGWLSDKAMPTEPRIAQIVTDPVPWIEPPLDGSLPTTGEGYWIESPPQGGAYIDQRPPDGWFWQAFPDGLIYRSYWAGVHEPRMTMVMFEERDGRPLWDATLGGRVGILRFGNGSRVRPQGWQLDFEGAAIMRFTLDRARDFVTADYRAGVPLTYGVGNWQFKFAYYHLSSHLGDEFAINNPGSLASRINYVRDALVAGASYYPDPAWRLYYEVGYALKTDGGAEPWEFQFGTELSRPGPTGLRGTPFLALNAHLREDHDFGGDFTAQAGWLWRGCTEQTTRVGVHYFNGKSSQFQTFDDSEEQIGVGFWYDF